MKSMVLRVEVLIFVTIQLTDEKWLLHSCPPYSFSLQLRCIPERIRFGTPIAGFALFVLSNIRWTGVSRTHQVIGMFLFVDLNYYFIILSV